MLKMSNLIDDSIPFLAKKLFGFTDHFKSSDYSKRSSVITDKYKEWIGEYMWYYTKEITPSSIIEQELNYLKNFFPNSPLDISYMKVIEDIIDDPEAKGVLKGTRRYYGSLSLEYILTSLFYYKHRKNLAFLSTYKLNYNSTNGFYYYPMSMLILWFENTNYIPSIEGSNLICKFTCLTLKNRSSNMTRLLFTV